MTVWLQGCTYQSKFAPPPYPGESKSLLRTDGLVRLTDKIKQRMKCTSAIGCSLLHVVSSYIKSDAPYAVGILCQILNKLS